jgi:hypothetical protein
MPIDIEDQLVAVGRWLDDASSRPLVQPTKPRLAVRWTAAVAAMVLLAVGVFAFDRGRGNPSKVSTGGPSTTEEAAAATVPTPPPTTTAPDTTTSSPVGGSSPLPNYESSSYSRDADGTRRLEFHFSGRVDDIPVVAVEDLLVPQPGQISLGQQPQTGDATICGDRHFGIGGSVELRFPASLFSFAGSSGRPDVRPVNDVEQFGSDGMIGKIIACPIAGQSVQVWIALGGRLTLGNFNVVAVGQTVILTIQPDLAQVSQPDEIRTPQAAEIRTLPLFMPTTGDVAATRVNILRYGTSPMYSYGHPTPDGGFDRLVWVMANNGAGEVASDAGGSGRAVRNISAAESVVEISATGDRAELDVQAIAEAIKSASTDRVVVPGRVGDLVRYVSAMARPAVLVTSGNVDVTVMRSSARLPLGDPVEAVARIVPQQVRGHDGWAVYDHDGRRLRVAWQEAPDVRVVVAFYETRSQGTYVDPLDVANTLRAGTPDDWASATELGAPIGR